MPSPQTQFTLDISAEDRIFVRFTSEKGKLVDFTVQYSVKTQRGWRTVRRYDTAHHHAHIDIYSFKRKGKIRQIPIDGEYGAIFTLALDEIKQAYQKMKEYFFLQ